MLLWNIFFFFFQAEDGIRDAQESRGLGDVYKRQAKALLKGMKNESGKAINFKDKLEAYSKWTKKTNMRIQDVGEEEDLGAVTRARAAMEMAIAEDAQNEEQEGRAAGIAAGGLYASEDPDYIDISDPNQGKTLKIGRKSKHLTRNGLSRDFDDMIKQKKKRNDQARKEGRLGKNGETKKSKHGSSSGGGGGKRGGGGGGRGGGRGGGSVSYTHLTLPTKRIV
eukprot:TRINITY_DN17669_c0_g1_i1.p1 TRINITY_DN17669_c0_g1~~TRINITY_DN17669_c0_g1_i1.p1  ORF type:complete len:223 (-),score=96.09 TRINITY_DN17669_c0_g1_i1:124-792(-)